MLPNKDLEPYGTTAQKAPGRWADVCMEDLDEGFIGEQEIQTEVPHATVPAKEVGTKPLSVLDSGASDDEKSCFVEE